MYTGKQVSGRLTQLRCWVSRIVLLQTKGKTTTERQQIANDQQAASATNECNPN